MGERISNGKSEVIEEQTPLFDAFDDGREIIVRENNVCCLNLQFSDFFYMPYRPYANCKTGKNY